MALPLTSVLNEFGAHPKCLRFGQQESFQAVRHTSISFEHLRISGITECSKLTWWPSCPNPRISYFSVGPWFLSVGGQYPSPRSGHQVCSLPLGSLHFKALSVDRAKKYMHMCVHICVNTCTHPYMYARTSTHAYTCIFPRYN